MNQKGWGLSTLIGFLFLFGFFLVIVAILYNKNFSNINNEDQNVKNISSSDNEQTEQGYINLENILKESAEEYINYQDKKITEKKIIPLKDLESYLPEPFVDPQTGKKCTGYIIYFKNQITSFVKCGSNYQTDQYDESF